MRSTRARLRLSLGLGAACALSMLVLAGPASAVAAVYPAGGAPSPAAPKAGLPSKNSAKCWA